MKLEKKNFDEKKLHDIASFGSKDVETTMSPDSWTTVLVTTSISMELLPTASIIYSDVSGCFAYSQKHGC